MTDTHDEAEAAAMNAKLRDDAAAWSKARAAGSADPDAKFAAPAAPKPPRVSRAKQKPVAPVVPAVKQPFSMSYDGTSNREYIARRVALGAR